MAEQNVEYQSLVQCTDDLTQLIQHNVVSLSSKLFAKGLVAKDVHDSVLSVDAVPNQSKAAKLLSCVIDKIRDSSGRFQDFIDVLGEDTYFEDIVLKITELHKTIRMCPDSTMESDEKKQIAIVDSNVEVQQLKDKEQVAKQIKTLQKSFSNLIKALKAELKVKEVTTEEVLESITIYLPSELKREYEESIQEKLPVLTQQETISGIFIRLGPHFGFLDYKLLEHLIEEHGSEQLKLKMSTYDGDIKVFLEETTITQLQDHLPGQQKLPPNFDRLQMMIDKDPGKCSLRTVNDLRRQFCSETHLSEIVFVLIGIGKANSFIIVFMVPSILGPRLVESVGGVDDSFYQRECIISISLNQQQLYLSVALREKRAECEKRLLILCASNTGDIQEFTYILSQPGVDPNIHDQDGRTPLVLASNNGRNEVIQLLLNHGAKIDFPNVSEFGDSPLIGASRYGHVATCQLLIDRGATVDYRHKEGATALIVASQNGYIKVVQLLLDCGAQLDIQCPEDRITSLHLASQNGHKEVIELLLNRGANVDILDTKYGVTALALAAQKGHEQVVEVLLKAEAKLDVQDKDGITALAEAALQGHEQVVDVLLKAGAKPDIQSKNGTTALAEAALQGHEQVVEVLLKAEAKLDVEDKDGMTALAVAAHEGHEQVVDVLLKAGAKPDIQDKDGWTALARAAYEGHEQVVDLLLKAGTNPDNQDPNGMTALAAAAHQGYEQVVEVLLKAGAKLDVQDKDGWTALAVAASEGYEQVVDLLLKAGAKPDIQDKNGRTALTRAASNGHEQVVDVLLKAGAKPDIQSKNGRTALAQAAYEGHEQVMDVLLKAGANPDIQDHKGLTVLMLATQCGHKDVIKVLLEKNASLHITNKSDGRTVLHLAAAEGNVEIFRMLAGGGADVEVKDKDEMTPFNIAKFQGNEDICDLLTNYYNSQTVKEVTEMGSKRTVEAEDHLAQVPHQPQATPKEADTSLPEEFDFVERPLEDFFCPVTFELLLDPHQTTCCGNHLSKRAVTRLKSEGKPCPICKEPDLATSLDKYHRRKVRAVQVRCPHTPSGCEWVGEVGELSQHIQTCLKRHMEAPVS